MFERFVIRVQGMLKVSARYEEASGIGRIASGGGGRYPSELYGFPFLIVDRIKRAPEAIPRGSICATCRYFCCLNNYLVAKAALNHRTVYAASEASSEGTSPSASLLTNCVPAKI